MDLRRVDAASQDAIDALYPVIFIGRDDVPSLSDASMSGLLLYLDETAIGFFIGRVMGEDGEIISMGMVPPHRGQGCAATLLHAGAKQLKAQGVKNLLLEVACDNAAAIRLYTRYGFQQVGIRKDYCRQGRTQPVDALVMQANLADSA